MLLQLLPLILIFVVFWFFLIRPQQKRAKEHREKLSGIRRGDQIVTGGGIIGKVTKLLDDNTIQVEIAEEVRVKVARSTVAEVLSRTEPASKSESANDDSKGGGEGADKPVKKSLFSFGAKK